MEKEIMVNPKLSTLELSGMLPLLQDMLVSGLQIMRERRDV
jgi:hypothetical protein